MSEEAEWPVYSSGRTTTSVKEAVRIAQSNNFMGLMCSSRLLVSSEWRHNRSARELTGSTGAGTGIDRVCQDGRIGADRRRDQLNNAGASCKSILRRTAGRGGRIPRQQCSASIPRKHRHVKTSYRYGAGGARIMKPRRCFWRKQKKRKVITRSMEDD